jgi:hypothetical protein
LSFTLNTESTYNYKDDRWSVPINLMATKIVRIDKHLISIGGGARYWAMSPDGGAEGWGARVIVTLLFPKH